MFLLAIRIEYTDKFLIVVHDAKLSQNSTIEVSSLILARYRIVQILHGIRHIVVGYPVKNNVFIV